MRHLPLALLLLSVAHAHPPVVDGLTGEPIAGATVEWIGSTRVAATDADGRFQLDAAEGWLRIDAPGYGVRETRVGTQPRLWPLEASDAEVERWFAARDRPPMDHDDLADPDLTEAAREHLRRQRGLAPAIELPDAPAPTRGVLKQGIELPESIRIYRRGPENNSCRGRVDVIPLEEYVRGVVPHEWIPSWDPKSMNAGAVAARGYAVGWIFRGGKYDCADLDDTTRSQVYRDDRDHRGDRAVEETVGQVIVRGGEFVASEYSAENGDPTEFGVDEPLCTGRERRGHGRGMCQWGTQRWATQRDRDHVWMVEHYFPGATVTSPTPPQADVQLRQRLARVDAQACADPEGTHDCADFVPEGWSRDLFDLYVGQRVALSVELSNTGGAPSPEAELAIDVPDSLTVDEVQLDGAGAEGGQQVRVRVPALAPEQTRTVRLVLRGAADSTVNGRPTRVRTWVTGMGDLYRKPAWDAAPEVNQGQTYNGGDLKLRTEYDVFDPHQWTWRGGDAEMRAGWTAVGDVASLSAGAGLVVEPSGPAPTIQSPWAPIDGAGRALVVVRTTPAVDGRVWWRGPGEAFTDERSAALVGGEAVMEGAAGVEQLRLQLDTADTVTVDEVVLTAPGAPPPPMPDAAPPPPGPEADASTPEPPMVGGGRDAGAAPPPVDQGGQARDGGISIFDPGAGGPNRVAAEDDSRFSGGCRQAPTFFGPALLALLLLGVRRRQP